ncbi:hypothetical protein [Methylotenera sp.]|uniref:hypothetical protein n=1 Tax=Methylotenera sp. TaxID=2051956 RepID=UPI0027357F40|nr:hypothetical protein [Methylotenera sp.]MDP3778389.1 hypothetical protein [Methylotenera sp.]
MSDTLIKAPNGSALARIRVESNGYQRLYKISGEFIGLFNPSSNTTHYPNGSVFCQGNALTALINF